MGVRSGVSEEAEQLMEDYTAPPTPVRLREVGSVEAELCDVSRMGRGLPAGRPGPRLTSGPTEPDAIRRVVVTPAFVLRHGVEYRRIGLEVGAGLTKGVLPDLQGGAIERYPLIRVGGRS